jgi:hypothetical protein
MAVVNIKGMRYGRLLVKEYWGIKSKEAHWMCVCDCGNVAVVRGTKLRRGHTRSCGCFKKEAISRVNFSHGGVGTRLYSIWESMRGRCHPVHGDKNYGLRGIRVCKEWRDFALFREWALLNGYADNLSIERVNVNGNYCPKNCTWIPLSMQASNTRMSVKYKGVTASEASRRLGAKFPNLVYCRMRRGWSKEKAFTTPVTTLDTQP